MPQAGKFWTKSDDPNYTKFGSFWQKSGYYVNHFWYIVSAILKQVLHVKQIMMLKSIEHKASIFHYSKNTVTLQTKLKVELNMGISHVCFETVRTLKYITLSLISNSTKPNNSNYLILIQCGLGTFYSSKLYELWIHL